MRTAAVLLTIFILIVAIPAMAIDFNVKIDNQYRFYSSEYGKWLYKANVPVVLEIQMANNSGNLCSGLTTPYRIYGTEAVETGGVNWIDAGGPDVSSIVGVNGFTTSDFFEFIVIYEEASWDGFLPDSVSIGAAGITGWSADSTTMKTRFEFHFEVPLSENDTGSICIDSISWPNQNFNWLFPNESDPANFGGPYCFEFGVDQSNPPEIVGVTTPVMTPHDEPFDLTYTVFDMEDQEITSVYAVDESGLPLGTAEFIPARGNMGSFHWTFNPPCSWVGETHFVTFYAENSNWTYPYVNTYPVELLVTNDAPVIAGNCGGIISAVAGGEVASLYQVVDANDAEEEYTWTLTVDPQPNGTVFFENGVFQFIPYVPDIGNVFHFEMTVADCSDQTDDCEFWINVGDGGLCGDFNFDGSVNVLDIIYFIRFYYLDGPAPVCP